MEEKPVSRSWIPGGIKKMTRDEAIREGMHRLSIAGWQKFLAEWNKTTAEMKGEKYDPAKDMQFYA